MKEKKWKRYRNMFVFGSLVCVLAGDRFHRISSLYKLHRCIRQSVENMKLIIT